MFGGKKRKVIGAKKGKKCTFKIRDVNKSQSPGSGVFIQ